MLPDSTTLAEYQAELAGALRHLRLQDAVIHPVYLKSSTARDPDVCVHPRYTTMAPDETILVTDLFAVDPAEDFNRLIWLAATAAFAACEGILTP